MYEPSRIRKKAKAEAGTEKIKVLASIELNETQLGKVLLTQVGQELALICGAEKNEEFYFYVIEKWFNSGYVLSTDLPSK